MKKVLALFVLMVCSQLVYAQGSATLEYDFLFGPTLELGVNNNDNYFYGSYGANSIGNINLDRYEIGWTTPTSANKRHNFGVSVGMLSLEGDDDFWLFKDLYGDFSAVSGKYSYYINGSDSSGFKLESEIIILDFDNVGITISAGYKFNF